ncbi:MAG: FAD-binding oxidoreductase [Acidobacteriota bacterium]|nr:FAD-binding oxidoreductase [Blastocatellia bacterium]MDW8413286.1 FAD-binding oxidoreductase [Acidobacteriota bacterium]
MSERQKWYGWGSEDKTFDLARRPAFWPYLKEKLGIDPKLKTPPVALESLRLPPLAIPSKLTDKLEAIVGSNSIRDDDYARITHSTGKSYFDLIRIRRGIIDNPPDLVVYPETITQIAEVLKIAAENKISITPFGGGTSVVGGVEPMRAKNHSASISLDMSRMNKMIELDEKSLLATFEAGIRGPSLEGHLQKRGYTLGHFPQSFEYSTLGGWLATRSAGQQSDRYGKIENMVCSVTMVTPCGIISTPDAPYPAIGPSTKDLIIGSEGLFGVIARARMIIHRLPQVQLYRGILFRDFASGIQAVREIAQARLRPATMRLSDEAETEMAIKMHAESESLFETAVMKAGRWYLRSKGYESSALMILGFEDTTAAAQKGLKTALEIASNYGGINIGSSAGEAWFRTRFEPPYLRDLLLDHAIMVDTLETSTTWNILEHVYRSVKNAIEKAITNFEQSTPPLVLCHISHSYPEGASLYFTFMAKQTPSREAEQWQAVKVAAMDAILAAGAAISHHHGIGRDHLHWAHLQHGKPVIEALSAVKKVLDPEGILNPGKFLT